MAQKQPKDPYKRFTAYLAILYAQGHTNASIADSLGVNERSIYKWVSKERKVGPLLLGAIELLATKRRA